MKSLLFLFVLIFPVLPALADECVFDQEDQTKFLQDRVKNLIAHVRS